MIFSCLYPYPKGLKDFFFPISVNLSLFGTFEGFLMREVNDMIHVNE